MDTRENVSWSVVDSSRKESREKVWFQVRNYWIANVTEIDRLYERGMWIIKCTIYLI